MSNNFQNGQTPPPPSPAGPMRRLPLKTSGMAIASLVLGILGIILSVIGIGILFLPIGLILGILAISKISKRPEELKGKGLAIAGVIVSSVWIIFILIGTIAGLVGVRVLDRLVEAKNEAAFTQISSLKSALQLYRLDNGYYPLTQQGLEALVAPPTAGRIANSFRNEGYLNSKVVPLDPWNNDYLYVSNGEDFRIWSMGADGRDQGGEGDDIVGK